MLQVNYALNFSSSSRPSLLATQMLATASPTTFREVTSISMGRLMARMREMCIRDRPHPDADASGGGVLPEIPHQQGDELHHENRQA